MTPGPTTTIEGWLKSSNAKLREAGVESPELSASLILSEATGFSRVRLIGFGEEEIGAGQRRMADSLLERRLNHEPMAYILGRKAFRNLTLRVDRNVLIPRPETEELIDLVQILSPEAESILDAGTGSGCIPLSLAEVYPKARVWGCDFSEGALAVAKNNDSNGIVRWLRSDWLEPFIDRSFDLIVSNPPYLTRKEMESLEPQVRDYEPVSALDGGVDGCDAYRKLIPQIARCLKKGGVSVLEIGPSVSEGVMDLLNDFGFDETRVHLDLAGRDRFVSGVTKL